MGYRNSNLLSLEYSIEIDESELQRKLEELGGVDDDRVREIVADEGYLRTEDLSEALNNEDVQFTSDLDDRIEQYVSDNSLISHDEAQALIDEAFDNRNADDIGTEFVNLTERVEALEGVRDDVRQAMGSYEARIKTLEDQIAAAQEAQSFFDLLRKAFALIRN